VRDLVDHEALSTSELAIVELAGVVMREVGDHALSDVRALLDALVLVALDRPLLEAAVPLGRRLRALDAIHLASALTVEAEAMLVYDRRLAAAAEQAGLRTLAPA
jgi:predicted nucleic acid-binding protein